MAIVNLANNTWLTETQTPTIRISTSNTCVDFNMGSKLTDEMCCAKACIEINASDYKTITLQYSDIYAEGITSLYFGVFDSMVAYYYWNSDYDYGISPSSLSGIGVTTMPRSSSGTITIDIPSDATGTKYVGFLFYGNTFYFEDDVGYTARQKIDIVSIDAVGRDCIITYDANGGSGTTNSQTATVGDTVTLSSNGFTAPTSKIWTLTLDGNGGNDGSPTFKGNYFHKWRTGSTLGQAYSAGDAYTVNQSITMYAWWGTYYIWGTTTRDNDIIEGYEVTFDANGGICDTHSLMSTITTAYDFLGWGNSANNPEYTFESDETYRQTNNFTAYAIWSPTTTNDSITLPIPTRNGYEFLGWSTSEFDEKGITGEYTPTENVVLYAIWKRIGNVYIYDDITGFNPYQVLIYDDSGWNQYIPYIYTESGWEVYSG